MRADVFVRTLPLVSEPELIFRGRNLSAGELVFWRSLPLGPRSPQHEREMNAAFRGCSTGPGYPHITLTRTSPA